MPLLTQIDQGGEIYLPFAKKKLKQWKDAMLRAGTRAFARTVLVSDGSEIYINSVNLGQGQYRDRIRIVSGFDYVQADPFYPLWGIQSALMPGTRAGVTPALSWSPTVQHVSAYYPERDGSYLRRHWLVICRYCKRVAEYTWDEVRTSAGVTTGTYVTHAADGSSVTTSEGAIAISPSLVQQSTDNPWGWIDAGPSDLHPGAEPLAPESPSFSIRWQSFTKGNIASNDPAGLFWQTQPAQYVNMVYNPATGYSYTGLGPQGTSTVSINYFGVFQQGGTWTHAQEAEYVYGQGMEYAIGLPMEFAGSPARAQTNADQVLYDAAYTTYLANHDAWEQRVRDCARNILQSTVALMDAKRYGVASELLELYPYSSAEAHGNLRQVVVCPLRRTWTHSVTYNSVVENFSLSTSELPALLPASIYSTTLALASPAVPQPPETPYALVAGTPDQYRYNSSTKAFVRATSVPAYRHTYFARGVPPEPSAFGAPSATFSSLIGYYLLSGDDTAKAAFESALKGPALPGGVTTDEMMRRLCVAGASSAELGFALYHNMRTLLAKDYRLVEHVHVSGAYSFTQPVIPAA